MTIRKATEEDVGTISDIFRNDGYNYGYVIEPESFLEQITDGDQFFILEYAGQAVGFISIKEKIVDDINKLALEDKSEAEHFDDALHLHILSVRKEHQSKKLGSALLRHGLEIIKKASKHSAYGFVRVENTHAIAIYEHLGFEILGIAPSLYGHNNPRYLIKKEVK